MDSLLLDLKYAIRGFRSRRTFTLVAVATLALGIGINVAIFTVADATLLRPLPFSSPERLVQLWQLRPSQSTARFRFSWPTFRELQEDHSVFREVSEYHLFSATWERNGVAEPVEGIYVASNFLDVLGIRPALGRGFNPGEDIAGAPPTVLVTDEFWRQHLGADVSVLGRTLIVDGTSMTIIGVLGRAFRWDPAGTIQLVAAAQPHPEVVGLRNFFWYQPIARLREGVSLSQAAAHLQVVGAALRERFPQVQADTTAIASPLRDEFFGRLEPVLALLFGGSALVLLLVCANIANLQLAYGNTRSWELAVRAALGATRRRLVQQLLTESFLLAFVAAILGAMGAYLGVPLFIHAVPTIQRATLPSLENLHFSGRVLGYGTLLAGFTVTLFGLLPAMRNSASEFHRLLAGSPTTTPRRARIQEIAVGFQVALAATVLSLALLSGKSLFRLFSTDPGFRAQGAISLEARFPIQRFDTELEETQAMDSLLVAARAAPGIRSAATIDRLPGTGAGGGVRFYRLDVPRSGPDGQALFRRVSASYFSTMGVPLLSGRSFGPQDREGAPPAAIVNQAFARKYFPREDPLDKAVKLTYRPDAPAPTIVGVVGDEAVGTLDEPRVPVLYVPSPQAVYAARFALIVRTDLPAVGDALRRSLHEAVPGAALLPPRPLSDVLADAPPMFLRKYSTWLLGVFGGYSLMLAALGVFGLLSFAVSERTREFGIRMSIGANQTQILKLVARQALLPIAGGVLAGAAAALALARLLRSFLLNSSPFDPMTIMSMLALLALATLCAAIGPALRATRIDPVKALGDSRVG